MAYKFTNKCNAVLFFDVVLQLIDMISSSRLVFAPVEAGVFSQYALHPTTECTFLLFASKCQLRPRSYKWRPINYSFVFMLIVLTSVVSM